MPFTPAGVLTRLPCPAVWAAGRAGGEGDVQVGITSMDTITPTSTPAANTKFVRRRDGDCLAAILARPTNELTLIVFPRGAILNRYMLFHIYETVLRGCTACAVQRVSPSGGYLVNAAVTDSVCSIVCPISGEETARLHTAYVYTLAVGKKCSATPANHRKVSLPSRGAPPSGQERLSCSNGAL